MAQQLVIADHGRSTRGGLVVLLGAILAGMGGIGAAWGVGYALLVIFDPEAPNIAAAPALACGLCLLPGLVVLAFGVHFVRRSRQLGVPTLTLPRTEPLCLGEAVTARFHRSGTAPVAGPTILTAELVCEEQVTYRHGTDNHTRSHEIYRRPLPMAADQVAGQVSGHLSVEVPVDQPPSLNLYHNEVIWTVQVRVQIPGVPDDKGTFKVTVLPVVAARLLGDAGGAGRVSGATP